MLSAVWVLSLHLTHQPQIIAGSVPGKFPEIPNEMRLVMKIELVRNQRPIDALGKVNARQNVAKAIEAAQLFWCTADHLLELYNEVLLAHPHTVTEFANRHGTMMAGDLCNSVLNSFESLRGSPAPNHRGGVHQVQVFDLRYSNI